MTPTAVPMDFTPEIAPVLDSLTVSALVALVPLVTIFVTLGLLKWKAHWAGLTAVAAAILVAVVAQFLVLPAITFVLTLALDLRGSLALGLILVACCPPGNVSNILTHRAGGDIGPALEEIAGEVMVDVSLRADDA